MKKYISFIKALNSNVLPKICFFLGDEDYLKEEAEETLFSRVCKASKGQEVKRIIYHCLTSPASDVEEACSLSSLFGGYRFIVLTEIEKWSPKEQKNFLEFLNQSGLAPSVVLVVKSTLRKLPVKVSESLTHVFWKFFESSMVRWVSDRFKSKDIKISSDTAKYLVELYAGADVKTLRFLATEIDKLSLYLGKGEEVTFPVVKQVCSVPPQAELFRFISALFERKIRQSMQYAHELFQSDSSSVVGYMSLLASSFSGLIQMKALEFSFPQHFTDMKALAKRRQAKFLKRDDRASIDKQLTSLKKEVMSQVDEPMGEVFTKGTVFTLSKKLLDADRFSANELVSALSLILTAEHSLKSGKSKPFVELEFLITRICTRGLL